MQVLRIALAINILLLVEKCFNHFPSVAEALQFPVERPFIGLATGTITSSLLGKLLHVENQDKPKCALSISNMLTKYRLINPFVYLEHGENPMPVPFKIETNSTVDTLFEAAAERKDTSGLLFYKIEQTPYFFVIFWKVTGPSIVGSYTSNRFSVDFIAAEKFSFKEESLKNIYRRNENPNEKSHFKVHTVPLPVLGTPIRNILKITFRAQMTTGKDAILTVEINDNLSPITAPQLYRRATPATLIGLGLTSTLLNFVFKHITKYIPSQETGTISLENLSKENSLINPSWFINAGDTSSVVPWEIKPSEKGTISFVSPFSGTKTKETFSHTVHFLSYQIDGTNYHLVIGQWFPWKIAKGHKKCTLFVMENKYDIRSMTDVLSFLGKELSKGNGNISQLSNQMATSIIGNIPDHKIHGVESSKLERYMEWQYPISTPTINTVPGRKYHIKIVAAAGYGKSFGLAVTVEVVAGTSLNETSFLNMNPQIYQNSSGQALARLETGQGLGASLRTGSTATMMSARERTAMRISGMRAPETATPVEQKPRYNRTLSTGPVATGMYVTQSFSTLRSATRKTPSNMAAKTAVKKSANISPRRALLTDIVTQRTQARRFASDVTKKKMGHNNKKYNKETLTKNNGKGIFNTIK